MDLCLVTCGLSPLAPLARDGVCWAVDSAVLLESDLPPQIRQNTADSICVAFVHFQASHYLSSNMPAHGQ